MSKIKKSNFFSRDDESGYTGAAAITGGLIGSIALPIVVPIATDYVLKNYFGINDITPRVIVDSISCLAAWKPMHYLGGIVGIATMGAVGYGIDTVEHNFKRIFYK
jgi:hypothetical protein